MSTAALINAIAADGAAKPPSVVARMALALALGGLITGALFMVALGVRPDIASALQTWRFVTKLAIAVVCLATALWVTTRLSRPDSKPRAMLLALALPLSMLALAVVVELTVSPVDTWSFSAKGSNALLCLRSIPALSLAPCILLLVALRAGAPPSPGMAGAAAGLLAGALAATFYALHCFDDSPLFVGLWYTLAIALVVITGAVAGHRVLRW